MRELVTTPPVSAEIIIVVTILLADLADVDRLGQLWVENFPLRMENVGGDLTVGSQPGNVTRIIWKLSPSPLSSLLESLISLSEFAVKTEIETP